MEIQKENHDSDIISFFNGLKIALLDITNKIQDEKQKQWIKTATLPIVVQLHRVVEKYEKENGVKIINGFGKVIKNG